MESREITGPWRATRLWNDIIRQFRGGMPVKKHRYKMKTYENCFSSSDAVEWLHNHLRTNDNFGPEVTREQTTQLLKKLYRAGIIENARGEEAKDQFKESGELYKFNMRSPVRNLRTPGKTEKRQVLADVGNTPNRLSRVPRRTSDVPGEDGGAKPAAAVTSSYNREITMKGKRDTDAMKKQLNLSYFQALPANSLIILDNDDTWRSVFVSQLSAALSPHHVDTLLARNCLEVSNVMHNMTKISGKGIVQLSDKINDLPHWVLSAMKCLANWPRQLRTMSGKESCLPNYPGFETDVFNVVKDYFLGLPGPLTSFPLYDFFIEAYVKAEAVNVRTLTSPRYGFQSGCHTHPHSTHRPCSRPYTTTDLDVATSTPQQGGSNNFYTMDDPSSDEIRLMSNQERIAKIRQTFEVLPPLSTSSGNTGNNSNSTCGQSMSLEGSGSGTGSVLSPDMSATAIMRTFLPPNTCFETAFMEESPITRIVPQKENETLHLQRSASGRSFTHIPNSWDTRSTATQTSPTAKDNSSSSGEGSIKRLPRWKRSGRLRKSIAVMESPPQTRSATQATSISESGYNRLGLDNRGFSDSRGSLRPVEGKPGQSRSRQLYSTSDLPVSRHPALRGFSSCDDLLSCRENKSDDQDFMAKYNQMRGDLRVDNNLFELSREKNNSFIPSKAMRKEKKKKKSGDLNVQRESCDSVVSGRGHCNYGLEDEDWGQAPLATPEESAITPYQNFDRSSKYNASYRLANNHSTPPPHLTQPPPNAITHPPEINTYIVGVSGPATHLPGPTNNLPRTSTLIQLPVSAAATQTPHSLSPPSPDNCLYVRAEPYLCQNSDLSQSTVEPLYASMTHGPYSQTNLQLAGTWSQSSRPTQYVPAPATSLPQTYSTHGNARRIGRVPTRSAAELSRRRSQSSSGYVREPLCKTSPVRDYCTTVREPIYNQGHHGRETFIAAGRESLYTAVGPGPIRRYTVSGQRSQSADGLLDRRSSARASRSSQLTTDSGRYSSYSRTSCPAGPGSSSVGQQSPRPPYPNPNDGYHTAAVTRGGGGVGQLNDEAVKSAISTFRLLGLLLPPADRRKLQLLLKFIKKVRCNADLSLGHDHRQLTAETFMDVVLRPAELATYNPDIAGKILQFFIDHYDEIWTPPETLRREVEERVYKSLVNKRIEAGEDPYPVTYCKQVTVADYEKERLNGAQSALVDLLDAILADSKLSPRDKKKKLKKFKSAYKDIWRRRFPSEDSEPSLMQEKEKGGTKFSSLTRIKNAVGV